MKREYTAKEIDIRDRYGGLQIFEEDLEDFIKLLKTVKKQLK